MILYKPQPPRADHRHPERSGVFFIQTTHLVGMQRTDARIGSNSDGLA